MSARGRLVTLEGVDGAGKSTHSAFVETLLRGAGRVVLRTREPGGTPLAEGLRRLVLDSPMDGVCEVLLMFAARSDHVQRVIRPALEAGTWVVCDRFTDATMAYQGDGKGVDKALIRNLAQATHGDVWPDLTLLFDCPFEVARARLAATGRTMDRFEGEGRDFFERVRDGYLTAAAAEPKRIRVIDASQPVHTVKKLIEQEISTL